MHMRHVTGGENMESQVTADLKDFILTSYLFGDESRMPSANESLLESGILDSTGVLELIEYSESTYHFEVADTETIPQNLGSIAGITGYVLSKLGSPSAAGAA